MIIHDETEEITKDEAANVDDSNYPGHGILAVQWEGALCLVRRAPKKEYEQTRQEAFRRELKAFLFRGVLRQRLQRGSVIEDANKSVCELCEGILKRLNDLRPLGCWERSLKEPMQDDNKGEQREMLDEGMLRTMADKSEKELLAELNVFEGHGEDEVKAALSD